MSFIHPIPAFKCLLAVFLLFFTVLWVSQDTFAQPGKGKKKDRKEKKTEEEPDSPGLILSDLVGADTSFIFNLPMVEFKNINRIPYYNRPQKRALLKKYQSDLKNRWEGKEDQRWHEMQAILLEYVVNFGIENFKQDLDLVWILARVAERNGEMRLAKEMYRLLFKNHRGSGTESVNQALQKAFMHYDSLIRFEKPLYTDLEYYYKLVERRRMIDTLQPPKAVLLDMGEEVNSGFDDYGLTVCGYNDDMIFFTSERNRDTLKIVQGMDLKPRWINEDLYVSYRKGEFWTEAEPLEGLNTSYNEGSPTVTKSGDTIVFARCFHPDGLGDCDLYISYKGVDEETGEAFWYKAINLGPSVNSSAWDSHPAFSQNADTIFFASARVGGFGGTDLYCTVRQPDGSWGKAINLGPTINTRASEVSPYPHPKQQVFYFSSNGQMLNFGGFDIFKSYLINNRWTEPWNIGPLVNGDGDEYYFSIDSKSKYLFYAKSRKQGRNKSLNLQSFPLPMEAQPEAIVRFSGQVIEPSTGEVFRGKVTVIDLVDNIEVAPRKIDERGKFHFELINHKKYLLVIEGDNFFRIEEMFYVDGETEVQIPATSINSTVTFESIDFAPNSAEILPKMENNLFRVIDFLNAHPVFNLKITGHTDFDGDRDLNLKLSQQRADNIKEYIVTKGGIDPSRIEAEGLGSEDPVVPIERTEEDKKLNRRVEFKIYKDL